MARKAERFYFFCSGLFLLAGGVLFLWGGSQHPAIGAQLGPLGSEEFFRHFVEHVLQTQNWQAIHTGILAGPVLWVLGSVSLRDALQRAGESQWSRLAVVALTLGALTWIVAFVFDGFVALYYAKTISESSDPSVVRELLSSFGANQVVVIRTGLVSWILIGIATASFAISIFVAVPLFGSRLRWILSFTGMLLGVWPLIAWWSGIFVPGPFTSRWWNLTAVTTALWYMTIGVLLMARAPTAEN